MVNNKFKSLSLAFGMAACLAAAPTWAATKDIAKSGIWKAFGGTTNDGTPVCGVSASSNGSYFALKFFKGDNEITAQLSDDSWPALKNRSVKLKMYFDDRPAWNATAKSITLAGDPALQFTVPLDRMFEWISDFANSHDLNISFVNQNDLGRWGVDLVGTLDVSSAFGECIGKIG